MKYVFTNNGEGNLAASIGTGDTSFSLEAGQGASMPPLAADEAFPLVVFEGSTYEWMTCTARSGDQLTVTRGPSPQSFNAGAKVEHRMNGTVLNSFLQKGFERQIASDPNTSALVPLYFGEEVFHVVTGRWWKHTTGTTWQEMNYHP